MPHRTIYPPPTAVRATPVASNVITVGSESRAKILASLLDADAPHDGDARDPENSRNYDMAATSTNARRNPPPIRSKRGFVTYTGRFNNVPVSIIMINMGYPNMDFLVRELREVTQGPLRIIRLGSCAGLRPDLPVGTVATASEGSIFVRQNPDAWGSAARGKEGELDLSTRAAEPYTFHGVAPADAELSAKLLKELEDVLGGKEGAVVGCLNASADSFYSSQGESPGVINKTRS